LPPNEKGKIMMPEQPPEKDDFIPMLFHDMKNPITAVIGSIDIIREGRLGAVNPGQAEYLQSAIESCQEVVTMIDNMLDMRRLNTGVMQYKISPVNPFTLLETAVRDFSAAAERENVSLALTIQTTGCTIAVDGTVLARVFTNLIGNAFKSVPEEGSITISCGCVERGKLSKTEIKAATDSCGGVPAAAGFVRISVSDNGSEVSSDDFANILERYAQPDNATMRSRGGAGLSLAFCKKAVESFGGCIWVENNEGEGSRFTILLPGYSNNATRDNSNEEKLP